MSIPPQPHRSSARDAADERKGRPFRGGKPLQQLTRPLSSCRNASSAIDFFWDQNAGTGTWDATSLLWRSGSSIGTLSLWPNTDPSNVDTARLAGTAGTLTLNSASVNINVNRIIFGTTGYIIAGPGSGTAALNLSGTTPTIDTGSVAATVSAKITGSAGLTKSGTGALTLSGNNDYTGVTAINVGTVLISHANALGSSAAGSHNLIRPLEALCSSGFLLISLMAPGFRSRSLESAVGTGVKHLRVVDVSDLVITLPPLPEQQEIVRRVEDLFAFADRIEARLATSKRPSSASPPPPSPKP